MSQPSTETTTPHIVQMFIHDTQLMGLDSRGRIWHWAGYDNPGKWRLLTRGPGLRNRDEKMTAADMFFGFPEPNR